LTVTGATTFNGPINLGNTVGNLVLNGTISTGTGTLTTSAAGTQTLAGGTVTTGNYTLGGNGISLAGGVMNVTNALTVAPGATLTGGVGALNAGTVNIAGTMDPGGGILNIGTTNVLLGGTLKGVGTVGGNVNNDGIMSPGNSPGVLAISGNFFQGSTGLLNIELGGTAVGTGYDRIVVGGNATLGGTLALAQFGSFSPAFGDAFRFETSGGTTSGTFSQILLAPAFAGMVVNYRSQFTEVFKPLPDQLGQSSLIAASQPIVIFEERDLFTDEEKKDIFENLCR
jgi:hypothetical protein